MSLILLGSDADLLTFAGVEPDPSSIVLDGNGDVLGWSLKIPKKWKKITNIVKAVGAGIAVVYPPAAPFVAAGILVLNAAEKGDVKALAKIDAIKTAAATTGNPTAVKALDALQAAATLKDQIAKGVTTIETVQAAIKDPRLANIAEAYKATGGKNETITKALTTKVSGFDYELLDSGSIFENESEETMSDNFDYTSLLNAAPQVEINDDNFDYTSLLNAAPQVEINDDNFDPHIMGGTCEVLGEVDAEENDPALDYLLSGDDEEYAEPDDMLGFGWSSIKNVAKKAAKLAVTPVTAPLKFAKAAATGDTRGMLSAIKQSTLIPGSVKLTKATVKAVTPSRPQPAPRAITPRPTPQTQASTMANQAQLDASFNEGYNQAVQEDQALIDDSYNQGYAQAQTEDQPVIDDAYNEGYAQAQSEDQAAINDAYNQGLNDAYAESGSY